MGLTDLFRRKARYSTMHLVGHIADDPQIIAVEGSKYMVFSRCIGRRNQRYLSNFESQDSKDTQ
jgi:hypothetical protein